MPESLRSRTAAARSLLPVRCYRSELPAALVARDLIALRTAELKTRAHRIADAFGGEAVIHTSLAGVRFEGLAKLPSACRHLWTRPETGAQVPLTKPRPRCTPEQRRAHAEVLSRWNALRPLSWVPYSPLYQALELDTAELQIAGIGWFAYGPSREQCQLYLRTAARIPEGIATPITAEEYSQIEIRVMQDSQLSLSTGKAASNCGIRGN